MSALKKTATTSAPIHSLISERWSPRAFANRPIEAEKLRSLFEAARWAASSYNGQPWYFIVGTKDHPDDYKRVLDCFVEFNQSWAKSAPVVALSVAKLKFEHNGEPNRHAFHDVGAASATLTLQAQELGLAVHQMGGILPEKAREIFAIPDGLRSRRRDRDWVSGRGAHFARSLEGTRIGAPGTEGARFVCIHRQVGEGLADCQQKGVRPS